MEYVSLFIEMVFTCTLIDEKELCTGMSSVFVYSIGSRSLSYTAYFVLSDDAIFP